MRQIEFRAWDIETKTMCSVWDIGFKAWDDEPEINYVNIGTPNGVIDRLGHEVILEQFTGLLDKNGKKIFEGDILRWSNGYKHMDSVEQVVFKKGSFRSVKSDGFGFGGIKEHDDGGGGNFRYRVIGNIHENKELLNEEP